MVVIPIPLTVVICLLNGEPESAPLAVKSKSASPPVVSFIIFKLPFACTISGSAPQALLAGRVFSPASPVYSALHSYVPGVVIVNGSDSGATPLVTDFVDENT